MKRICKNCQREFLVTRFNRSYCKECKKILPCCIYDRKDYDKHKEYYINWSKNNYKKNKEKYKILNKQWKEEHLDEHKEYQKDYIKNHRDKINKLMNKAYYKNKKKHDLRSKASCSVNRKKILAIIGNRCIICGSNKIQVHHKRYINLPTAHKDFNKQDIKKIKKYLIPLCRKHHQEIHKEKVGFSAQELGRGLIN